MTIRFVGYRERISSLQSWAGNGSGRSCWITTEPPAGSRMPLHHAGLIGKAMLSLDAGMPGT
jgi:hypothetical protein